MSISISDAMQLNHLKSLNLVSGKNGLGNKIGKIGILDYEVIEGIIGGFYKGDFVLTTFTGIRGDYIKIEKCIKDLIKCNVSALAIKNIYVKKLPKKIIDFANENNFPIFIFEESVFFEDIIEDLMAGMQTRTYLELMESKIEILFKNDLKKLVIKELAYELNTNFYFEHIAIYCKEKKYINDDSLLDIAERYQRSRSKSIHFSVYKYQEGLLIILSYKKITEIDILVDTKRIFKFLNISKEYFYIGKSEWTYEITLLDKSIKESIYAARTCELLNENEKKYSDIGIYKLLLPYSESRNLESFTNNILEPLKSYDNGKLIETARVYISCGGDISSTAKEMFQHKNTIRYRINKMKTLLDISNEFYIQLYIAIKSEKILK